MKRTTKQGRQKAFIDKESKTRERKTENILLSGVILPTLFKVRTNKEISTIDCKQGIVQGH